LYKPNALVAKDFQTFDIRFALASPHTSKYRNDLLE
jgi:hypothetical protein